MTKQSIKNLAGFVNALDQTPNQLEGKVILSEMLFDALEDLCREDLENEPLSSYLKNKLLTVQNLFRELQKPYSADYEVCNAEDSILNLNPGEVYEPNKN